MDSRLRKLCRSRILRRWLVIALLLYVGWCAALYFMQDRMLFAADMAPAPLPLKYDATTVELIRTLPDGAKVVAWYLPALKPPSGAMPTAVRVGMAKSPLVIYFHGNAEIIDYQDESVRGYRRLGFAILLPEYRGYGRCGGRARESGIVEDAVYFYDQIIQRPDVDPSRIIFHGRSLGGGVAAQLAARRPPAALVLESTFTSVADMALGYAAPPFLVRNPFHVKSVLAELDRPSLILHGDCDDIIPVAHGRRLAAAARRGTYHEFDCRHNDFPGDGNNDQYWRVVREFLTQHRLIDQRQTTTP